MSCKSDGLGCGGYEAHSILVSVQLVLHNTSFLGVLEDLSESYLSIWFVQCPDLMLTDRVYYESYTCNKP